MLKYLKEQFEDFDLDEKLRNLPEDLLELKEERTRGYLDSLIGIAANVIGIAKHTYDLGVTSAWLPVDIANCVLEDTPFEKFIEKVYTPTLEAISEPYYTLEFIEDKLRSREPLIALRMQEAVNPMMEGSKTFQY